MKRPTTTPTMRADFDEIDFDRFDGMTDAQIAREQAEAARAAELGFRSRDDI